MMRYFRAHNFLRAAICLTLTLTANAHGQDLSARDFGTLPLIEAPRISPDGKHIAAILNGIEGPTVVVSEFGSKELTPLLKLEHSEDRLEWVRWANNNDVLVSASVGGTVSPWKFQTRRSRLYAISRNGGEPRHIGRRWARDRASVMSTLPDDPEHILMQLWSYEDQRPTPYRVNIVENTHEKVFRNEQRVDQWYADSDGFVSIGAQYYNDVVAVWHRRKGGEWRKVHSRKFYVDDEFSPVLIDGDTAYVLSDHETGRLALWRFDISTGEYVDLIYAAEGRDLSSVILSDDDKELLGVSYYDRGRVDHYFDAVTADEAALIKSSFPDFQTWIQSRSLDRQRLIVGAQRDNSPPKFFHLDLASKSGGFWYSSYPQLEEEQLAPVQPVEFPASDGYALSGFLTLPINSAESNPPLIVFPHGGPGSRDYWRFDPFVQLFARRGYAVLQVNFRGSEGFGNAHRQAGYRQWGQLMQQDVYDAIDWLAEQDLVDVNRKCIVGASYGGYVALTAAFQKPAEYQCVVSIAGVSDLVRMVKREYGNEGPNSYYPRTVGHPRKKKDLEMLKENSPINYLSRIEAPMLIVHGTRDTRVQVKQSRTFVEAATAAGKDVEYLEIEDGTHFLDEFGNRLAVFEAVDGFLSQHL